MKQSLIVIMYTTLMHATEKGRNDWQDQYIIGNEVEQKEGYAVLREKSN